MSTSKNYLKDCSMYIVYSYVCHTFNNFIRSTDKINLTKAL